MSMESSVMRTEQFSGAMKSFLQQLRMMLTKQDATSSDHKYSASDWNGFFNEAVQQTVPLSQEARERHAIIAQVLQSADADTKMSVADALLFADDFDAVHDAIMTRNPQQQKAA